MSAEVHVFVVWPFAMSARERILADIAARAEIIAQIEAGWPDDITPEAGYRRFYGALLPDAVGKVKRAGAGKFLVVIVRIPSPRYDWRMTQRGLELVNLDMFEMKWLYREWVGGLHRVHGTNSVREARRDIMLLTGHSLADWESGRAVSESVNVLPGQKGWRDLREVFSFLNEVHPYAVMRNAEGLPEAFTPSHDDVDMMVESAKECVSLLKAVKAKGGGAAYRVKIGGHDVKFDIREVTDGYYDESWARAMMSRRNVNDAGVGVFSAEDTVHSLLYHILYMKRGISPDYRRRLPGIAAAAGIEGKDLSDWAVELERYMSRNGYFFSTPVDSSVRLNRFRVNWRRYAFEATELFSLSDVRPVFDTPYALELTAEMDGAPVRVIYSPDVPLISRDYDLQLKMYEKDAASVAQPLMWHTGTKGAYLVTRRPCGTRLAELIDGGTTFAPVTLAKAASEVRRLVDALDAAKVVHRNIDADSIRIASDGSLTLEAFGLGVDRKNYKTESPYFRRRIAARLVPLGGRNVPRLGCWNDRLALANVLRGLPNIDGCGDEIRRLEDEVRSGVGELKLATRKLRLRLLRLYLEIVVRGLLSPRRRTSDVFRRIRSFVWNSL